jgi:hypothetical protein
MAAPAPRHFENQVFHDRPRPVKQGARMAMSLKNVDF